MASFGQKCSLARNLRSNGFDLKSTYCRPWEITGRGVLLALGAAGSSCYLNRDVFYAGLRSIRSSTGGGYFDYFYSHFSSLSARPFTFRSIFRSTFSRFARCFTFFDFSHRFAVRK